MSKENIVVLIPAYNPTEDLIPLVKELLIKKYIVVIVNDGSNPDKKYIFDKLDKDKITFLEHNVNKGKGQALKTGFEYIKNNIECIGVVTADADGQHLIEDICNVANTLIKNQNSLVLGSRLDTSSMPFNSKFGNTITRFIFKFTTGTKIFDTQTGLRGIPYTFLNELISLPGQRYEYEINMLIYASQNKMDIIEVKIQAIYFNKNKASSFNAVKDSFKIYKCIFKYTNINSVFWYTFGSITAFIIDFAIVLLLNKALLHTSISKDIALLISVLSARALSSIIDFTLSKKLAFKDESNIFKALIKYYSLAISIIIINYLLLNLLTIQLSFNLTFSKLFVELLLFISNYIVQKKFIFKKKTNRYKKSTNH